MKSTINKSYFNIVNVKKIYNKPHIQKHNLKEPQCGKMQVQIEWLILKLGTTTSVAHSTSFPIEIIRSNLDALLKLFSSLMNRFFSKTNHFIHYLLLKLLQVSSPSEELTPKTQVKIPGGAPSKFQRAYKSHCLEKS